MVTFEISRSDLCLFKNIDDIKSVVLGFSVRTIVSYTVVSDFQDLFLGVVISFLEVDGEGVNAVILGASLDHPHICCH